MRGLIISLILEEGVDEAEVVSQLAELNAIPGVAVIVLLPNALDDVVGA